MLKAVAIICGYKTETNIIFVEELIYLVQFDIPNDVKDVDDYLWDESERILFELTPDFEMHKTFHLTPTEIVIGELFDKEVRQISKVSFKLKKSSPALINISKCFLTFQSEADYSDYLMANEPDNPDKFLNVKMSRFFQPHEPLKNVSKKTLN